MNKKIIFVILFSTIFLMGISVQESHAQYVDSTHRSAEIEWYWAVENILPGFIDEIFLQNETVVNDSIKTRISKSGEDVLPPRYHVRILYDVIKDEKVLHMDSIYKVNFITYDRKPNNTELVKIYETEYKSPQKITPDFELGTPYVYGLIQHKMCRQGFEMIEKVEGSPACVKPKTAIKLVERGWATSSFDETKKSWVVLVETRCGDPWDDADLYQEYKKQNPQGESQDYIYYFYSQKNIEVFDLKLAKDVQPATIHSSCHRLDGSHWHMQIPEYQIDKLEDQWYEIPQDTIEKYSKSKVTWRFIPIDDFDFTKNFPLYNEQCGGGYIVNEQGNEISYQTYGFFRDKVAIDYSSCQ